MTPAELTALMESSAPHAVLDVRERGAYERGHIFRATSLPRRLLELRVPALVTAPHTPIVLYDDDGRLSALARTTLGAMGYRDARVLAGGLHGWREAGRPVVEGVNVPSKVFGEQVLHDFKTPHITPAELEARMRARADMVIVDSRTPEEYARGCVPGAINVPGGELVLRIGELVSRPETTIVVHCGGRTRSYLGAESLRRMGLPNPVVALENGTMGWSLAGFELERGASRWAPSVSGSSQSSAGLVATRVAAEDGIQFVTAEDLGRLLERRQHENVGLLDVRTADEYAAGHIAGAVWAPGGQAVQATDEYVAVRAATIVLACDGSVRSVLTASWLMRMGYPRVRVLAGGIPAWERAGGAMERGHLQPVPAGWEMARAAAPTVRPGALDTKTILNVDPSDVYTREHVPGAAWLCRSRLEVRIAEAVPDRRTSLVVTCADGVQSTLATATLIGLGYAGARVLEGGTGAWAAAGLPVERGATRLLDEDDDVVLKAYDRGREGMVAYLRWEEALDRQGRSPHQLLRRRS
ncbi:MAG TPA: rhodanese-like domain-containing protein [Methylomirabilota bacterium]|nr:rhodanese-like domain-containing protein [Methylomirabilota bacterium]